MLKTPTCYIRGCTHYLGVLQPDGTEDTEVNYCKAFPNGIPRDIAYGKNLHGAVVEGQIGNYVFVEGKEMQHDR
jgi:hypothetical protein